MGLLVLLDAIAKPKNVLLSIAIFATVSATVIANIQEESSQEQRDTILEQLPFCGDVNERTIGRRLLYITTLDGKLTALDISKDGREYWSLATGPGSLISSSIHRLELTNNGQFVRMIPSLSGGIYKFDGHTIDPIPITAENLLSSSFKFSDDLVISGGKETRSYGVSVRTGEILYECNMQGCHNYTETVSVDSHQQQQEHHDPLLDDVIVVRRQTQTVRAVEPRTGSERWNFSVGYHELEFLMSQECHDRSRSDLDMAMLDLEVKVIVPEGLICAFSKSNPSAMLWKHQFSSPIVSAWQVDENDALKSVDIFNSAQWVWTPTAKNVEHEKLISPSIYLGMFQKQLYIQESAKMRKLVTDQTHEFTYHLVTTESSLPSIPWKPIPATSSALVLISEDATSGAATKSLIPHEYKHEYQDDENTSVTALSVLYASEYVNGNGFFLYTSSDLNKTENALCNSNATTSNKTIDDDFMFAFSGPDPPVQIIILSLWYWWKEIVVISLTSAFVLNLLLSPKVRRERQVVVIERHIPVPTAIEATEENIFESNNSSGRSLSESGSNSSENFVSRFQTDFDLIQCLGKGGFGVVFEAKNKLDERNYAVKRITLPNKKDSRERVMREVKTLAKCEHQNIVRYFQAWVETPPPGWQEIDDEKWMQRDILSTSIDIETPDGTTLPKFSKDWHSSVNSLLTNQNKMLANWSSGFIDQQKELDTWYSNKNNNGKFEIEDDSCSSIQFKNESKTASDSVAINIHSKKSNKNTFSNKSDSFEIEFKHSTNASYQNNESHNSSVMSEFKRNTSTSQTHKRPLSLDLNSKGNIIVPVPPKTQNRVYLYIQMQLCRKQSLRDWLRENKTETRQPHIKSIFEQIVDAVDYVHLKGLIHRDLKPSNIFFSLDGQIKIGDFGLVTDTSDIPNMDTASGDNFGLERAKHTQQVGTHLYMSPEQLQGKPYDFKVDIFSLGLILFELLRYFETEMERVITLKGLRDGKFPTDFKEFYPDEFDLLKLMLSTTPFQRPATFQIKEKLTIICPWGKSTEFSEKVPATCRVEYNSNAKILDEISSSS